MNPKKLTKIMKALSNENRLALYLEIAKREQANYEAPECNIAYIVQMFDGFQTIKPEQKAES
ncbi:hypothetical protein KJ612_06995 [Myxococcota bacterium]|nr:hypothetical protein [Myxococcota bacterium]MBU1413533.1 hypothetical protein [Myxococcota bacterium]